MISNIRKHFGATASVITLGLAMGANTAAAESLDEVMERRGLSQKDLLAAAKTYTPTGGRDEFIVFSSGGQSGQVMVYGVPSMRILKYVSVFTPEPWQGYGFDEESKAILESGKIDGREIHWGDTHHPAITETNGDVDGEYLFINDKSAPRVGVISLHDFETQQIVVNPILQSEHGGTFVTPNSEYVIEAAQYPGVLGRGFAPLSEFNEKFRGAVTYWKFDAKQAGSTNRSPSRLSCRPIRKTCRMPVKACLMVGPSPTRSVQNVMSVGSNRVARRSRQAVRKPTPITCTSSTGKKPPRFMKLAK
ncbi:hypothetical protein [Aliiroseovarius crassostreae]|uniref:hypothetical protein n=1 Tax=Aliiroseovarius crassostreae TaxID=154981 RepID=UPI003C79A4BC